MSDWHHTIKHGPLTYPAKGDYMTSKDRVSDERLAALIQYGAPGGLAPHDFMRIVRELQERRASETKSDRRETGWLVENGKSGSELRYRTIGENGWPIWTADNLRAIRFARRQDAEMFSAEDEDAWCIVEHQWITPTSKAGDGQ